MAMSRKLNEKEFMAELEKLEQLELNKCFITVHKKGLTFDEVKQFLKDYDGIKVIYDDGSVLKICGDTKKWYWNDKLYGIPNITSTEDDEQTSNSVPFTGSQIFERYMKFFLDLD